VIELLGDSEAIEQQPVLDDSAVVDAVGASRQLRDWVRIPGARRVPFAGLSPDDGHEVV